MSWQLSLTSNSHTLRLFLHLLHDKLEGLSAPLAKFIYDILAIFYSMPMYVPAPYIPLRLSCLCGHNVIVRAWRYIFHILLFVGSCEMAGGSVSAALYVQGRCIMLGGSRHNSDSEGFSQQAMTRVAIACMFLPVHAHVCSTKPSCSLMGQRWLILSYPILSYTCKFLLIFEKS